MARMMGSGNMTLKTDFSGLAEAIGAAEGMFESVHDKGYLDDLVAAAHATAEEDFNVFAAASAASGAGIRHMFEWGTLGINRGRTNVRPSPTQERARLWQTHLSGHGLNKTLTYTFKPSVAFVPKPTVRDTGMSPEVIENLRLHVFTWKASVLETGAMVTIIPKNTKRLLIPYYRGARSWFSSTDIERGYTMLKGPVTHSPGDTGGTTGNFTTLWLAFWQGRGNTIMNQEISESIERDFRLKIERQTKRAIPRRASNAKFKSMVNASKRKTKSEARRNARNRSRGIR